MKTKMMIKANKTKAKKKQDEDNETQNTKHYMTVRILCPGLIRKNLSTTVPVVNTK